MFKKSIILCVIFLTSLHEEAQSLYLNSTTCKPQDCGNGVKVSFPFWITTKQKSYCGLPSYNITCVDDQPFIKIHTEEYIVRDIYYSSNSVRLATPEVYDAGDKCPIPRHNLRAHRTLFSYGPNTADLVFFYNCTEPFGMESYPVDCAKNESHHAFAVFRFDLMEHKAYSIKACQPPVNMPVEVEGIDKLLEMSYVEVLKRGFILQWKESRCRYCEESGGSCGHYNSQFLCFCHNQTHAKTCPLSSSSLSNNDQGSNFSG